MTNLLRVLVISVSIVINPLPLWSQVAKPTQKQVHTLVEQALTMKDAKLTVELADSLLSQDASDFQALLLLSLARTKLGQHKAAATAASRAYRAGQTSDEKLQAARIAGGARFNAGQYTRAEWWLRRAANHAKTVDTSTIVQQEFQAIRQQNPLSVRLGLSVAPSNNINGGSEEEFFYLDNFKFIFSPNNRALSGVEYSGDIELSYRISKSQNQTTSIGAYLYGRTYSLSSESQATVPDISGSDYALTLAEVSLNHRRILIDGLGPTGASMHTGQIWYGGNPLWRYNRLALSQGFLINQRSSAMIRTFVEKQDALDNIQPDTTVYDIQGIYARRLANQDIVQLSLGCRFNDAVEETYTYTDCRTSINYNLDKPVFDTRLSFAFGVGHKNYDEFSLSLDGRKDNYVKVGATAVFEKISYFGFSPSFSITASRTVSNVTRFSNLELQGKFSIQSNF